MFSAICVWINDWVNNREAGDFRRYRGHYDVNVMSNGQMAELIVYIIPLVYMHSRPQILLNILWD